MAFAAGTHKQRMDLCGIRFCQVVCTDSGRGRKCETGDKEHKARGPFPPSRTGVLAHFRYEKTPSNVSAF